MAGRFDLILKGAKALKKSPVFEGRLKETPSTKSSILRQTRNQAGLGAGVGLGSSLADNIGDDEFDLSDTILETLAGGALGGAFGALGAGIGLKSKGLGTATKLLGPLTAAGNGYDSDKSSGGMGLDSILNPMRGLNEGLGGLGGMEQAAAKSTTGSELMDYLGGVGAAPNAPSMTIEDYRNNARLNAEADEAIALQLKPFEQQISAIKEDEVADLGSNVRLGEDAQTQMGKIQRDNAAATDVIIDDNKADVARTTAQSAAELQGSGALGAGNDYTRDQLAAENAQIAARHAERAMSDEELLERLGLSTAGALSELRAAETMQTGQNASKIRTDAKDDIQETRTEMSKVSAMRPGILQQFAQGAFDSSIRKHEAARGTWKDKFDLASAMAGQQQARLNTGINQQNADTQRMQAVAPPAGSTMDPFAKSGVKVNGGTGKNGKAIIIEIPNWYQMGERNAVGSLVTQQQWDALDAMVNQSVTE